MFGTRKQDKLIPGHCFAFEAIILDDAFYKSEFTDAGFDRRSDLSRVGYSETDIDLRIGVAESDKMAGQPVTRDCLACLNGKRAAFEISKLAQRQLRPFDLRQDDPSFQEKRAARLRELNAATNPIEELGPVTSFKSRNGVACCRLREIELSRRLRDVLALGYGHEDAQLIQCHAQNQSKL